jgi:hypothetical protein
MKAESIQYILDELGGGKYRRSGDHLMSVCPLSPWTHNSGREKTPSFGVKVQEGIAPCNCFTAGCDASGTLFELIEKVGRRKVKDGEWTQDKVGSLMIYALDAESEIVDDFTLDLPKLPIEQSLLDALGTGSAYWRERGVDETTMREWRLFEAGKRAFIPVIDPMGEVIAMQGRLLPDEDEDSFDFDRENGRSAQSNKYRTFPPRFDRERHFAGEHLIRPGQFVDMLIVVEGIGDAPLLNAWLKAWWAEERYELFPFGADTQGFLAVSTMGAKYSPPHVQKMVNSLSARGELVIGFDKDEGGIVGGVKLSRDTWRRVPQLSLVTWERNDPSDRGTPPASMDTVREDAYTAIRGRTCWLDKELGKVLTRKG